MKNKNKFNEDYKPENLDDRHVALLTSLRRSLTENVNKAIKEIDSLKSSVTLYGTSFNEYIDLAVEKQDCMAKYSKPVNQGNSYNLPGVFATSAGSYDIQEMRKDNARMEQLNNLTDVAEDQRDAFFKMMVRAQNEMKIYLSNIVRINNEIDVYLSQISEAASWQGNIHKK